MAFLLLVTGFEPTASLIGNGVLVPLPHPGQLGLLRSEPSRLPGAIEELLRYEAPLHVATIRFTTEPVVVAGTEIPDGALVLISMLAANRDAQRLPTRTNSTSPGRIPGIWPSGTAFTTAPARRWPGWKGRSPSGGCWTGSPP